MKKRKIYLTFRGLLNGFWLKNIMLLLMVSDHVYYFSGSPRKLYIWHIFARIVAPVFAYLMAQGMVYTRSRERYIMRMYAFAAVMSIGNAVLFFITKISIPNNIFLSLALSASLIYLIDKAKEGVSRPVCIALAAIIIILSFYCEGQYIMPMISVIFYYFRADKLRMYCVYLLSCGLPYLIIYALTGRLQTQFYMVFAVIPLMLYDGRRGPDNAFAKYFFYIFYPLHVWVIVLVKFVIS